MAKEVKVYATKIAGEFDGKHYEGGRLVTVVFADGTEHGDLPAYVKTELIEDCLKVPDGTPVRTRRNRFGQLVTLDVA